MNKTITIIMRAITFSLIFFAASAKTAIAEKIYDFYVINYEAYQHMIYGHDPFDLENWDKLDLDRHRLEALIFFVAPVLGGCDCQIHYHPLELDTPHARAIEEVKSGKSVSHPITVFSGDSRVQGEDIYLSQPILRPEDFFVGLYTYALRDDVLRLEREQDIKNLTYIAGRGWEIDNKILDDRGLKRIEADNWESLLKMIVAGRADVVMQPFQNSPDLSFVDEDSGKKFLPIPNVKMRFPQGRQYFVSKHHPEGSEFLFALNAGIEMLEAQDNLLVRAHEWAGVLNPQVSDYQIILDEE